MVLAVFVCRHPLDTLLSANKGASMLFSMDTMTVCELAVLSSDLHMRHCCVLTRELPCRCVGSFVCRHPRETLLSADTEACMLFSMDTVTVCGLAVLSADIHTRHCCVLTTRVLVCHSVDSFVCRHPQETLLSVNKGAGT